MGGWVDADAGIVKRNELLRWNDVPVREMLSNRLDHRVFTESTVRAHAIADILYGAVENQASFLHVFIGNVIELATVVEGSVQPGLKGFGGDLSRWRIEDDRGDSYYAVDFISDMAIRDSAREAGIIPRNGSHKDLLDIATSETPQSSRARKLLVERARHAARMLAALTFAFGPDEIVVSQRSSALPEEIDGMRQEFESLMERYPRPKLTISPHWRSAIASGGAAIVLEQSLKDYTIFSPSDESNAAGPPTGNQ